MPFSELKHPEMQQNCTRSICCKFPKIIKIKTEVLLSSGTAEIAESASQRHNICP
jgi:hypothetical protein